MSQTVIDLSKNRDKIFTRVFYQVRKAASRYVAVFGGAGSSKSYSVHQSELINIKDGNSDTLFIRKHGSDIRESCFKLLQTIIQDWGVGEYFRAVYSNDNRSITYLPNGNRIIFKGIDDPEKMKSIAGIKRIIIEEATQLTFADWLEIVRRARGINDIQIILIFNPISENHWIKKMLCDPDGPYHDKTEVLKFTYHDNQFLTEDDIAELERLKTIDENQYRIYVRAEWGVEDKQKKFAWAFDKSKHVVDFVPALIQMHGHPFDPSRAVWLSFDFNVDPMSCTCFQHYASTVFAFKCFKLNNSSTYELCDAIKAYFPPGTVFMVTGDASGASRNAMAADGLHNYLIIKKKLRLQDQQLKVPSKNPGIKENRVLLNAILSNYNVWIQPGEQYCEPDDMGLIYDLTYVELDENQNIIKDRTTNKKKSDFLDTFRYFVNVEFPTYLK